MPGDGVKPTWNGREETRSVLRRVWGDAPLPSGLRRSLGTRTKGATVSELERAREYHAAGKYRKAVDVLWEVPLNDDSSPEEAKALLDLATALRNVTQGRLQRDCERHAERAEAFLASPSPAPYALPMPEPRACPDDFDPGDVI